MRKDEKQRKNIVRKLLTILTMAVALASVSFSCGASAYADTPTMIGEAAYYEAPTKIGDSAYTEEVYETELVYEVPEEKEEDQTIEDDPQAYREELRQDAMAKEEWKELCQKWQNFKKFILDSITTLIQR